MAEALSFLLERIQGYISANYTAVIGQSDKRQDLRSYIEKYIRDHDCQVEGFSRDQLISRLFSEMAEYSVLTPYLDSSRKDIEEININSWDDMAITYTNGRIEKAREHFLSPKHAVDICKRLLQYSGMVIDSAMPLVQGHLPGNIRISAIKSPIVGEEQGIGVSIRLLHPSNFTCEDLIAQNTVTQTMIDFLRMCLLYGVSFVIAGGTSTGKTTALNTLLKTVPDSKRIYTIESGSRELALVRRENGRIANNVVGTLSRPSDNPAYDISQEDLVVYALRFNPDIVVVGEMRDTEAYAAVEAAITDHTVVSTVHSGGGELAHERVADLCQKRYATDNQTAMRRAARAFPVVVYAKKMDDSSRKIMDISECVVTPAGQREYHTLYRYHVIKNQVTKDGRYEIDGYFEAVEKMSESLKIRLIQSGVPYGTLQKFL